MRVLIGAMISVLVGYGCTSTKTVKFGPIEQAGQMTMYEQGIAKLGSSAPGSIVIVKPGQDKIQVGRVKFVIAVSNKGTAPFDVSTESVAVAGAGIPSLKVYSYDELVTEEENKKRKAANMAAAATFLSGMSGIMASAGGGSMASLYQTQAQATQMATMNVQEGAEAEATLQQYQDTVLRRTTVVPGSTAGGYIYFDAPMPGRYDIEVTTGLDRHRFSFEASEIVR